MFFTIYGIGRINSNYQQNPYYTTMKEFVKADNNSNYLQEDTVLEQGVSNPWSKTTVVYGPIWTLICSGVSMLSFGNIDIGLAVFKIINVIVHMLNCYLIYKLTNKKLFVLLYGLNPFILMEGIVSVHNDIYMIFFILLSLYVLLKKKKIALSIAILAVSAAIKYFSIILLPFIIIYYFRNEKPGKRFLKCIQYGLWFLLVLGCCYLFYVRDFYVLQGLFTMQTRHTKNFYVILRRYFSEDIVKNINTILLGIFTIFYGSTCIKVLFQKTIKWKKQIQKANIFLVIFLFVIITNFHPWYVMWLFPIFMWQKSNNIKALIAASIISQYANMIFFMYKDQGYYGILFTYIFTAGTLLYISGNQIIKRRQKKKLLKKYVS